MSKLDDVLRGLPATQAAAVRQAIRHEQRLAARPERVSYGAKYTPKSGVLAGVEFRNRDEYRQYQAKVREANALVRAHGVDKGEGRGNVRQDTDAGRKLRRLGHELFARVHKDDNEAAWAWLIDGWYRGVQ